MGGRRPFGFEQDMTIRDVEASAVRQAYDDILAGVPLAQIARDWNDAGLLTPLTTRQGEPSRWTGDTVRPVLLNPRNAGLRATVPSWRTAPARSRSWAGPSGRQSCPKRPGGPWWVCSPILTASPDAVELIGHC